MTNIIQHTTIDGQRWDQIATERYGVASKMNEIIEANPGIAIYDILPGGIVLDIPIIDKVDAKTNKELLPPWKQ